MAHVRQSFEQVFLMSEFVVGAHVYILVLVSRTEPTMFELFFLFGSS